MELEINTTFGLYLTNISIASSWYSSLSSSVSSSNPSSLIKALLHVPNALKEPKICLNLRLGVIKKMYFYLI